MPLSNASRLADFGTGIGTAGAIIQVDNVNQRLGVGTANPTATLGVAGIVSATAFYGDGSNLDGVASAGLGTALSEEEFNPLTVIYQTSDTLSVGATITVDPPDATTKVAYTQYAEVKLEGDADLIVADGDDFIPDILGLSTEGFSFSNANGNGIFDTVYTDNIENAAGRGAPNFPLGITVSGISTLSGNVSIGGTLTYEDVTNVDSVGVVTARSGIDITGASAGLNASSNLILKTGGTERVRIQSNGSAQFTPEGSTSNPNLLIETSGDNIRLNSKKDTGNGGLIFVTQNAGTSSERLRIGSAGQLGLSGANYGTSGQVMTSQGNSAAPQWADASGGAWSLLSTTTVTSSTEIEIAIPQDGAYDEYAIKIVNLGMQSVTGFRFRMKVKIDGSYPSGTPYAQGWYGRNVVNNGNATGSGNSGKALVDEILDSEMYGLCATFIIPQPMSDYFDKSIYMPQLFSQDEAGSGTGAFYMGTGSVSVNNTKTNNLTSIVIFNTQGGGSGTATWNTGKVKLYGIS